MSEAEQDTVAQAFLKTLTEMGRKEPVTPKPGRKAGSAKGLIWMSPDFDEPLEDFKEYM